MRLSYVIIFLTSLLYISQCYKYCLKCPQGTIWLKETSQCQKISGLSDTLQDKLSHCIAYQRNKFRCLACEEGYFVSFNICRKNPEKGQARYIENCQVYQLFDSCYKCTAPLIYYEKTRKCIDARTLIPNCRYAYYDRDFLDNQCELCYPGYHLKKYNYYECFEDPKPGQRGYKEHCLRYFDPVNGLDNGIQCQECQYGYQRMAYRGFCEKSVPAPHCTKFFQTNNKLCLDCDEGYYLNDGYKCEQCNYQIQDIEEDYQQTEQKFLQINSNN